MASSRESIYPKCNLVITNGAHPFNKLYSYASTRFQLLETRIVHFDHLQGCRVISSVAIMDILWCCPCDLDLEQKFLIIFEGFPLNLGCYWVCITVPYNMTHTLDKVRGSPLTDCSQNVQFPWIVGRASLTCSSSSIYIASTGNWHSRHCSKDFPQDKSTTQLWSPAIL